MVMISKERKAMALILGVSLLIGIILKVIGIPVFYAVPMGISLIALFGFGIYMLLINKDVE